MENEITYHGESVCEVCGFSLMYSSDEFDFTITRATKREHFTHVDPDRYEGFFDHDCEMTVHDEYDEPVTRTVEY